MPVPVIRTTAPRSRLALLAATALVPVHWAMPAGAGSPTLPAGGNFAAGSGAIAQSGASLTVNQTTNRAVIDWKSFSIGTGGKVTINNGSGATLNRVTGAEQSRLAGSLSASGSVYLVNPNGVLVLPGGRVVTGGDFVASSLSPGTAAFMQGGALTLSGTSRASVINNGDIVSQRGDVLLIARDVASTGSISAAAGSAALIAAQQVVLMESRSGNAVSVELPGGDVTASGAIKAASVRLNAAGGNIYALAGNNGGLIEATGTSNRDGRIWLSAGGDTTIQSTIAATGTVSVRSGGTVAVSGKIAAAKKGGAGGLIDVNGGKVILSGATLDASGTANGGSIVLGGTKDSAGAAGTVVVDAASTLLANGGSAGNGGSVSLWSTTLTDFRGTLQARGGAGGTGGNAEISSAGNLNFAGAVGMEGGRGFGALLLDPTSVNIVTGGASTFSATASALDPLALVSALASANLTVSATTAAGGITVSSPVSWSTAGILTLNSGGTISINAALSQAAPIGTTGGISLIAGSDIYIGANLIGTGGTVNVLANANTGGSGGGITLGGATGTPAQFAAALATQTGATVVISTTGDVTLGGGSAGDGSGYAVGSNSFGQMGVAIVTGASVVAGGTVAIRGIGGTGSSAFGVGLFNGKITGSNVTLAGTITASGVNGIGVRVGYYGFVAGAATTASVTATTGDVTITGDASSSSAAGSVNAGIFLNTNAALNAPNGSVQLRGTVGPGGTSGGTGVWETPSASIVAGRTIGLWGMSTAPTPFWTYLQGTQTVTGAGGAIDITGDFILITGSVTAASGSVSIQPVSAGRAIAVGTSSHINAGTLSLVTADLSHITAGTLTIGSSAAGGLRMAGPVAFSSVGNLNLVSGGILSISAPLSLTIPTLTAGTLSLIAGNDIFVNGNITGSGGAVRLLANANTSGHGGGIEVNAGSPVNVNVTGDLIFGGGTAGDGSGYAFGLNTLNRIGVYLYGGTSIVAGGTATIRGTGGNGSFAYGVDLWNASIGAGAISIYGSANPAFGTPIGVMIADGLNPASVTATAGNVTIIGGQTTPGAPAVGIGAGVWLNGPGTVTAAHGSVLIDGTGVQGVHINSTAVTITARDTISVHGSATAPNELALSMAGKIAGTGAATEIDLIGDRIQVPSMIATAGLVSIVSTTAGWATNLGSTAKTTANTLELSAAELGLINAGTLAIGSPMSGDMNLTAPIALTTVGNAVFEAGGTLSQFSPLSLTIPAATSGKLALIAGGDIFIRGNIAGGGGTVSLLVNSNKSGNGGGITIGGFFVEGYTNIPTTINVTGGATLGGGTAGDGSDYAVGLNSILKMGIVMTPEVTLTAGGAVTLRGQASDTAFYGYAIEMQNNDTIVGSSVSLFGKAPPSATIPYGVMIGDSGGTASVTATNGDVTISGSPTQPEGFNSQGVGVFVGAHATVAAPLGSIIVAGTSAAGVLTVQGSTLSAGHDVAITGYATIGSQLALDLRGSIVSTGTAGAIVLTGDWIAITGSIVTPGSVFIQPRSPSTDIDLGSTDKKAAGKLELSAAELGLINAGTLAIGSASSGALNVTAPIALTTVGNAVFEAGGTLSQFAPLSLTIPAVNGGGLALIAGGDIFIRGNIAGGGGTVSLLVNANKSGNGGGIEIGGGEATVNVGVSGNLTLGGGTAGNGSGYAVGLNTSYQIGVFLNVGASIVAGGTATVRGQGGNSGFSYGVDLYYASVTAGAISIHGLSNPTIGTPIGVMISDGVGQATLTAASGDITITGGQTIPGPPASANGAGVWFNSAATVTAANGSVLVDGTGVEGIHNPSTALRIAARDTIALTGSATAPNRLAISLAGTLNGTGAATEIDLTGDRIAIGGTIVTPGLVSIQPPASGWNVDLGSTAKTTANTLELSAAELGLINAGTLAIGSMKSGGLTQTQPLAFTTVHTLALTGGTTLTLAAPLSLTTPAGIFGGISLVSGADMYLPVDITGAGGPVDLVANSNASGTGGGIQFGGYSGSIAQLVAGSMSALNQNFVIRTTGNITFGGGTALDGSGYAVGLNTYFHEGINFFNYATIIAGGTVAMRGQGGGASSFPYGINTWFSTIQASDILLSGISGATAFASGAGVLLGQGNRLTATTGNIVITGDESSVIATPPSAGNGIYLMSGNTLSAPGGSVLLTGTGGAATASRTARGVQIDSGTSITAGHTIGILGSVANATQLGLVVSGILGSAGSTAEIDLTGDRIGIGGMIVTSGRVSIAPLTYLADVNLGSTVKTTANTLELSAAELALIQAGTLDVVASGTVFLSAALNTVSNIGNLNLHGDLGIVQTAGSLAATELFLFGGHVGLTMPTNAIGTVAALSNGALDLNVAGPLTVGTVLGFTGIHGDGTVDVRATGTVSLAAPISSFAEGDGVVVSAAGIISYAGAAGLQALSGRWLAFAPTAGAIAAGGLTAPYWLGTSIANYDSGVAIGSGNRFVVAAAGILTVTPNPVVTTYGTAAPALTYSITGLVSGDSLAAAVSGTPGNTGFGINGGVYNVTATLGSLLSLENYVLSFGNGTLTVNKAPLTVAANNLITTYGQAQNLTAAYNVFQYSDTPSSLGGTLSFSGQGTNAGAYTVTPAGLTSSNYTIGYTPGTLTVNKAPLTVAANNLTTTYGQAQNLTAAYAGFQYSDTPSSLGGALSFSGQGINAGPYTVTPAGLASPNYAIHYGPGTLLVNQAPLTVAALDVAKTQGTTLTFNGTGFSTVGLIGGDRVSAVTLSSAGTSASAALPGSPYPIDISGAEGIGIANYAIAYLSGKLIITAPASASTSSASAIAALSLPVVLPTSPQPSTVSTPVQLASLTSGLSSGPGLSLGGGPPVISDAPAPALLPSPAPPTPSPAPAPAPAPAEQPAQAAPAANPPTPVPVAEAPAPASPSPAPAPVAEATPAPPAQTTPNSAPSSAAAEPASPPMQVASLTTGASPADRAPPPAAAIESPTPAAGLAQGDPGALQSTPLAVPANVSPDAAQTAFADRTSQLVAGGMSPAAAAAGAAKAVEQMGAATTRTGAATPAQSLGDSLAAGASGAAPGNPALGAALARGQSPAQALATAAAAARTEAAMQAAATVPTSPGNAAAAGLANGGIQAAAPNPAAFALALASGRSPAAALAASRIAAQTSAEMTTRANLAATPERQASTGLAAGDLGALPGISGNPTAEAALAAALALGGSMDDARTAAARAAASLEDQQSRGAVTMSDRDACAAAMAAGAAGGCGGTDAAKEQRQLQTAEVRTDPDASALAEGRVPQVDADSEVVNRLLRLGADPQAIQTLLRSWNETGERQAGAARVAMVGDRAALIERLSQGRASPDDIEQITRMARAENLESVAYWLRSAGQGIAAAPQADRRRSPGTTADGSR